MTWVVGLDSNFFGGVFGLLLFLENLLLNVKGKFVEKKLSPKVKKSSKM